jgi:aspartate kinase
VSHNASEAVRPRTVVQKFGGSSLATQELREVAASRVLETRARGVLPVVVCSAMGRAPDPYATDTLAGLIGPVRGGPNRDLILGCGELISCAVFAELLRYYGAEAQAMTGAQAGIFTDESFANAKILNVDPSNVLAALEEGIIPVIAGFQGVSPAGALTTLGRGGSDFTAVALGDALGSDSVDIYTDVSGVMTGDPRRVDGARTILRVNYEEMVELAGQGAKVMHDKAASYARVTRTPYSIKGLSSNVGTTIDEGLQIERMRPVTGITALRDIASVSVLRETVVDQASRERFEVALFGRLADDGISIDMVNVNAGGIFFVFDAQDIPQVKRHLDQLAVAADIRPHCAKLSIVGAGMRGTSGVAYRVVHALVEAGVRIIHTTDSNITISVLVSEDDVARAEQALHDAFRLARPPAGRAPDGPVHD